MKYSCNNTGVKKDLSNCDYRKANTCKGCIFLKKDLNFEEDEELTEHFIGVLK